MSRAIHKLTFVTDAPHFGGAERYIVDMARAAARRGIEPHIHWLPLPDADEDIFGPARVGSMRVTFTAAPVTRTALGMVRETRSMLRRERPDALVINAAARPRFWMVPWCAKPVGIPSVWVHQMVEGRDHRRLRPKWLGGCMEGPQWWRIPQSLRHRMASMAVTSVITLNAEDRNRILRWQLVSRDSLRVVPHGVDCERFRFDKKLRQLTRAVWFKDMPIGPDTLVAGTAGRLVAGKRVDLLIEATAILRARGVDVRLVIAGQGPQQQALQQLAESHDVRSAVHFLDFLEEMPAFHNGLDVFALCSDTESFGLVLAEAMACERPVVATPTAGARRQIRHGENGYLLPGFESGELADVLHRLHRDSRLQERMGRQGRRNVLRHFSIELTLERTLRALREAGRASDLVRRDTIPYATCVAMTQEGAA